VAVDPAYLWPDLVTAYSARTNLAAIKELISAAATVMRVPAHSRLYDPGIACLFSFARGLEKYFARGHGRLHFLYNHYRRPAVILAAKEKYSAGRYYGRHKESLTGAQNINSRILPD